MPAVCAALDAAKFQSENQVVLSRRSGPRQGANASWAFSLQNSATRGQAARSATSVPRPVPNADVGDQSSRIQPHVLKPMTKDQEAQFHEAMLNVYERAKRECRYTATRFFQMVTDRGGLAAARMLLASKHYPDGLTRLWEEKRLDISMEVLVLSDRWRGFFSEDELAVAAKRLRELGYKGPELGAG
jgi:hypothetical protein